MVIRAPVRESRKPQERKGQGYNDNQGNVHTILKLYSATQVIAHCQPFLTLCLLCAGGFALTLERVEDFVGVYALMSGYAL